MIVEGTNGGAAAMSRTRRIAIICVLGCEFPLLGLLFYALGPIVPDLARVFDDASGTGFIAQVIVTAPALCIMIGGWLAGALVDRFGGKPVQAASFAVYAIAGSAGLFVDTAAALLITRFLTGIAAACIATSNLTLLGGLFDPQARARLIGRINGIGSLLNLVGVLLVGQLADAFGWRAPFALFLVGLPLMALALIVIGGVSRDAPRNPAAASGPSGGALLLRFLPAYAAMTGVWLIVFMGNIQLPFLLELNGMTAAGDRSIVMAASSGSAALVSIFYLGFERGIGGRHRVLPLLLALIMAGFTLIGVATAIPTIVIGSIIAGLGTGFILTYSTIYLIERATPETRGRALGLMYTANFAGELLNPFVLLPLRLLAGLQGMFLVTAVVLAVALVAVLVVGRGLGRAPSGRPVAD